MTPEKISNPPVLTTSWNPKRLVKTDDKGPEKKEQTIGQCILLLDCYWYHRGSPLKVMTNTAMETIQETRLFDSPNSSMRSWRKMPKLLMEPYVNISTKKKATPTTHPQPPSGACGYTLGPRNCNHLAQKFAMVC